MAGICNYCSIKFPSVDQAVQHMESEYHRWNKLNWLRRNSLEDPNKNTALLIAAFQNRSSKDGASEQSTKHQKSVDNLKLELIKEQLKAKAKLEAEVLENIDRIRKAQGGNPKNLTAELQKKLNSIVIENKSKLNQEFDTSLTSDKKSLNGKIANVKRLMLSTDQGTLHENYGNVPFNNFYGPNENRVFFMPFSFVTVTPAFHNNAFGINNFSTPNVYFPTADVLNPHQSGFPLVNESFLKLRDFDPLSRQNSDKGNNLNRKDERIRSPNVDFKKNKSTETKIIIKSDENTILNGKLKLSKSCNFFCTVCQTRVHKVPEFCSHLREKFQVSDIQKTNCSDTKKE